MATTISGSNDTSTAFSSGDDSWRRPLAIALPVCLIGIPLVTVIIIVIITCYRSKFKQKKLNDENRNDSEAAEIENKARENRTENPASLGAVYANLSETVEEARRKEEMGANISKGNGIATGLRWPLKLPWKKSQLFQVENIDGNAETKKDTVSDVTDHRERRIDEEEEEEEEAGTRINGTGVKKTPGRIAAETVGTGNPIIQKANGQAFGLHGVPMRKKEEMKTTTNQHNNNAATPATLTKPNQTVNRKTFVVMYSMDSEEPDYLSLLVNDVIFSMEEEKDGWIKGEKRETGEIGWFPRTHVREGMSPLVKRHSIHVTPEASSSDTKATTAAARTTVATMATSQQQCDNDNDAFEDFDDDDDDDDDYETGIEYQALYPYRATEDGDINFDAGEIIVVVEKQDNGWWRGYHGDDHGFFPGSYVQLLRSEELSQSLPNLSQATGVFSASAFDIRQTDDPDLLLTLAEEEEEEGLAGDYVDALQQKQKKDQKKQKNGRKSIGVFLRKIATPYRTGSDTAGGTGQSPVIASHNTTDPIKTKKTSHPIFFPAEVKQKKNKHKANKTKMGRNLVPMARRSSLAPAPPQSGLHGTASGDLVKDVMSGLAHKVAAEAQLRHDPFNTTYEEIGTTDLFIPTAGSDSNPSETNNAPLYDFIPYEEFPTTNFSDVTTDEKSSASLLGFGAKRNDVTSGRSNQTITETYLNLDFAVQLAAATAKGNNNRRGQELKGTEDNKHQRVTKNREQSKQVMSTENGPSSMKPVPPQKPKPSYIGSTPNIAELLSAIERRADGGVRRPPGNKPRPMAKPSRLNFREGRGSDLGLTAGSDLKKGGLPPTLKPKPLTEKPRYLSRGFPQGMGSKTSDHQMQRRDIYRSLDSIMAAVEAEDEDEDAAEEPEIMNWLRKKLSADAELTGRGTEVVVGRTDGVSQLEGSGKEMQQMQMGRTMDISDGNVETKDGARIILKFERLSEAGLNEESFV